MGAAGDMLMSALYELLEDKQGFLDTMNGLGLPGVRIEAHPGKTCGIAGTHMAVTVYGEEEREQERTAGTAIIMSRIMNTVIMMNMIITMNMGTITSMAIITMLRRDISRI